ncbi:MAG: hypothetical protein IRY99_24675 [Isosphaeraceae bacterium]|nr:hypothetical protein [Isosphaeraceae bacterium]
MREQVQTLRGDAAGGWSPAAVRPPTLLAWPRGPGAADGPQPPRLRDDDSDGVREVHVNTLEGLWTGLRNFLRPFRGVNKGYLYQYVAMFVPVRGYVRVELQREAGDPAVLPGPPGWEVHHQLPYMNLMR